MRICATTKGSDQPAHTPSLIRAFAGHLLEYYMTVRLLSEHHLKFLSLKGACTGSPESIHVKMIHCWKFHIAAQLLLNGPRREKLSLRGFRVIMVYKPNKPIHIAVLIYYLLSDSSRIPYTSFFIPGRERRDGGIQLWFV